MGCFGSRHDREPVHHTAMRPPMEPPVSRPARQQESPEAAAQRQREKEIREAATAEMVRRIEQDSVLMLELQGPLRSDLVRSGMQAEIDEAWPPPRVERPSVYSWDVSGLDLAAYKRVQRQRYVREAYENAVGRLGRQMMVRQGWRPWNHCTVRSAAARLRIVVLFIAWSLKASPLLSTLPRDVLYMIFTYVAADAD